MSATPRHTNRLIHETSPYLLQHAHNPVDWFPWGDEALGKARAEDKPILLSIGYSACHWCHVMEHESFEDEEIARVMSDHFVCIKVDREERPDLDDIYMTATMMMNQGQGGWPMTVFLTPDQKPFFAGTYFPPVDRYGRPGFRTVLEHFARQWRTDRGKLVEQAGELTEMLRQHTMVAPAIGVGEPELDRFAEQMARGFDKDHGGFGAAPKFPPSMALLVLLRQHARTGDAHLLEMATRTLHAMADGGIYDHVGGGFARYSTDEKWLVPHFEKMLYDNALLVRAYLEAYQVTGEPKFARVAREVLDYVLAEMSSPSGGFYSATDADSEGVEGKFFVWTPDEIDAVLGREDGRRFRSYYNITTHGNFEGKNIPNVQRSVEHVARELGIAPVELERSLGEGRAKLHAARQLRVPPLLDDKVLTSWNGLMISAMAEGHRVLDDDRYLAAGERAAEFLLATLSGADGRLLRTWRAGKAHLDAYLEDHAYLAVALIELFEAGGAARWLDEARRLCERMLAGFRDPDSGAFFATAHEHEELIVRSRTGADGAVPAGNAMAAWALARLAVHLDRPDFREATRASIQAYGRSVRGQPRAFATSLLVVDFLLSEPIELVLIGRRGAQDREVLEREVARHYVPNHVIVHHDPTERAAPGWPLLEGRATIDGRATLYVCRAGTCLAPLTDPAAVADVLRAPRATHGRWRAPPA